MKALQLRRALAAIAAASLLLAAGPSAAEESAPVLLQPRGERVEFAPILDRCVEFPDVRFGPGKRWSDCRLQRAGFVSTIGLIDFYHASYCLIDASKDADRCDRQALVIFGNRAYRPESYVVLHRVDAPGTAYDVPLVTGDGDQNLLIIAAAGSAAAAPRPSYYFWKDAAWQPFDGKSWQKQIVSRLGRGLRVVSAGFVDPHSLSARVSVADAAGKRRTMLAELSIGADRFMLRSLSAAPSGLAVAQTAAPGRP